MVVEDSGNRNLRPVKFLLPASVVRAMDQAILQRAGGYADRHELARDAIEAHVLELLHGADSNFPTDDLTSSVEAAPSLQPSPAPTLQLSIEDTALAPPKRGPVHDVSAIQTNTEPLLGLHNRDYPSLWALSQIAELVSTTEEGTAPVDETFTEVTHRAWTFAAGLAELDRARKYKVAALFPTNRDKPQSSSDTFKTFALATFTYPPEADQPVHGTGPLIAWRALAVTHSGGRWQVGLTADGWDLLETVGAMTIDQPHDADVAARFLAHLSQRHAGERWAFRHLLQVLAGNDVGRIELAIAFAQARDWSKSVAESTAQGYVARAREWGLVEMKLHEGRYRLTDTGHQHLEHIGGAR